METLIIPVIIILAIILVAFLILRQVMLWYFKINTIVKNMEYTIKWLQKIYIQMGGNPVATQFNSDEINNSDWVVFKNNTTGLTETISGSLYKQRVHNGVITDDHEIIEIKKI